MNLQHKSYYKCFFYSRHPDFVHTGQATTTTISTTTTTTTTTEPTTTSIPADAPIEVRLGANGGQQHADNEGYVEINVNNQGWGGVCDDYFDLNDAHVLCRMLGFPDGAWAYYTGSWPFGFGSFTAPFAADDLKCIGNETSIADCPHREWYTSNCGRFEWAGVQCNDGSPTTTTTTTTATTTTTPTSTSTSTSSSSSTSTSNSSSVSSSSSSSSSVSSLPWWAAQGLWQAGGSGAWGPYRTTLITSTPLSCHTLTIDPVNTHGGSRCTPGGWPRWLAGCGRRRRTRTACGGRTCLCSRRPFCNVILHLNMSCSLRNVTILSLSAASVQYRQHNTTYECTVHNVTRLQQLRPESKNLKLVLPCFLKNI